MYICGIQTCLRSVGVSMNAIGRGLIVAQAVL